MCNTTIGRVCYQHYLRAVPSGRVKGQLSVTSYGMQEFWICDLFDNILIFAEPLAAQG